MKLTPKNWNEFQHYTGRRPPWIKLHRKLLDDYDFACLPVASRALAPCLWLLASEHENGEIALASKALAFRLHMSEQDMLDAVMPLVKQGFFICDQDASTMLAERKQSACLESETEREKEVLSETTPEPKPRKKRGYSKELEEFWLAYPTTKTMSKQEASKAWDRLSEADRQAALSAVPAYKAELAKNTWQQAVHACRFLSQRRFEGLAAPVVVQFKPPPGLSSEELRAKHAKAAGSPVVGPSASVGLEEQQLVSAEARNGGTQRLGDVFRKSGIYPAHVQRTACGQTVDGSVPMAGMDDFEHDPKDQTEL